eukprot:CAMPEP_0113879020 /NCGR_PEP_ID=MMETSP0780_2-20120614/7003_1 /TAXON_ID=652834 /ORGANISM="Palpitomonas bilix" /LENGTH=353 /DNA_ID=CAMNT_0000865549 /DNA_START=238 /DNA_END=1299 /DNA_ORIENTATION=- /assembly_acc=CAM_ASM_000599
MVFEIPSEEAVSSPDLDPFRHIHAEREEQLRTHSSSMGAASPVPPIPPPAVPDEVLGGKTPSRSSLISEAEPKPESEPPRPAPSHPGRRQGDPPSVQAGPSPSLLQTGDSSGSASLSSPLVVEGVEAGHGEPAQLLAERGVLVVSGRQRGNPVLKKIKHVKWQYGDLEYGGDYLVGKYNIVLFLSLRYHLLQPGYIYSRIDEIRGRYRLRVLLCMCDVEDNKKVLEELSAAAMKNDLTLVLAWSADEAARYLESFKAFEHKGPEVIQGKVEQDYFAKLIDILTSIRSVNKSDAMTLASTFGSLHAIATASIEELTMCPGLGEKKVKNIIEAFNSPLDPNDTAQKSVVDLLKSA